MRKLQIILFLLVIGISLGAEIIIKPEFNFALISPDVYDLDLSYSSSLKRLYVDASFSVDPATLPEATYHCFFLSKDVHLEQIYITDKLCGTILANNLVPLHFNPDFPQPELLDSTSTALCYSFNLHPLIETGENIDFRLVYWVEVPELAINASGEASTTLSTDMMWLPRNLIGPSTINLSIKTPDTYQVRFGDILNYADNDGIRTHKGSISDAPNKYLELTIFKKLN